MLLCCLMIKKVQDVTTGFVVFKRWRFTLSKLFACLLGLHILAIVGVFYPKIELLEIFLDVRLVRFMSAYAVGGILALSAYLLQILSKNYLAEPYMLGLSSIGSCAGLCALVLFNGLFFADYSAFLLAALAVLCASLWLFQPSSAQFLLLRGMMLNAIAGAMMSIVLQLAPPGQLPSLLFWLMGDMGSISMMGTWNLVLILCLMLIYIGLNRRQLSLAFLGEAKALSIQKNITRTYFQAYAVVGIATALVTMHVGSIGFIGFMVAHWVYALQPRLNISKHVMLCVGLGGALLSICDHLARSVIYPSTLPIGAITAIIGVPIFLRALKKLHQ